MNNTYTMPPFNAKKVGKIALIIVIIIFVIALIFSSIAIVPSGHKGVLVTMSAVQEGTLNEGFNLKIPFFQSVQVVDVRVQKYEVEANSASRDLQQISSTIALNFRVSAEDSDKLYKNIGANYASTIIDPAIAECVKSVTSRYTAEELITKRTDVSEQMKITLQEKLKDKYIFVNSFNIVDFGFSEQFNKAIEEKQIAEQNALKAKYDLTRIQTEAEQQITQAKAEAEALKLKSTEVTRDLIFLEYIQKWDGKLPTYFGGGNFLFNVPYDESQLSSSKPNTSSSAPAQ